jgi:peroxiredoxin
MCELILKRNAHGPSAVKPTMRQSLHHILLLAPLAAVFLASCADVTNKPAPDLNLKTTDNQQIKLSDLKGKVVVLDFWATWCPPCRESLPNLAKLSADPNLAARGLKVIAIHSQQGFEKAKGYVDDNHLPLTVALDTDGSATETYKVEGFPTTIVIGRDGTIQHKIEGFGGKETEDELNAAIEKALAAPAG